MQVTVTRGHGSPRTDRHSQICTNVDGRQAPRPRFRSARGPAAAGRGAGARPRQEAGRGPRRPFGPQTVPSATSSFSVVYWAPRPFPFPTPRPSGLPGTPWRAAPGIRAGPTARTQPGPDGQLTLTASQVLDCAQQLTAATPDVN